MEGFLCSRKVGSGSLLRCYDWATGMVGTGKTVMGGFSSAVERDVLDLLLRCRVPVIIVLARKLYKVIPLEWHNAIIENRLLVISFSDTPRQSAQTAAARNRFIINNADNLTVGSLDPDGTLAHILSECDKPFSRLDLPIVFI